MVTILIVEDDALLLDALTGQLKQLDYAVCTASSVPQAMALLQAQVVDGIMLDLGLPGTDGMELLVWVRQHIAGLPVLVLTARDGVDDR
ncbi:MAG: response regulator transcription factor, partial [Giesbergeria sp.]